MRWLTMLCTLALLSCGDDPGYNSGQFASELAKVHCDWIFSCCDSAAEQEQELGSKMTKSDCITKWTASYLDTYQSADPKAWNGQAARDCANVVANSTTTCPRTFDPAAKAFACPIVAATKSLGKLCTSAWECTSKFCKSGVCAEPFTDGMACGAGDVCAGSLRCAGGKCTGLKGEGLGCASSDECVSGQCSLGKCTYDPAAPYFCDGKD